MPAKMTDGSVGKLNRESARYFRTELQKAREDALKDAEAFDGIIHVVEKLGQFLTGRIGALGNDDYKTEIKKVAENSSLASEIPIEMRSVHTPFSLLYNIIVNARNDAMHIGASARHLTKHTIELALIFEDAMKTIETENEMHKNVSDYMVPNPVCAELWQPVSFVRQKMLANSFTYLPVKPAKDKDGEWKLVSDFLIAKYLQGQSNTKRNKCLAKQLQETGIELLPVKIYRGSKAINEILEEIDGKPSLVFESSNRDSKVELAGILTAFDLL